jgi:molybdopterin/thiamine biosynthesis adenylyltransferase
MKSPEKTDLSPDAAIQAPDERLDRQVRIPGWNQAAITQARVGVVGDDPWLTGLVVTAAAALGVNRLTVVAPELDQRLMSAARGLNPELALAFFPGYFSHVFLEDLLRGCNVLIDLSHHALATKLLFTLAHREGLPLVRGYEYEEDGVAGLRLFSYQKGREWREVLTVLPRVQLPSPYRGDPVLALVTAGLVLEETKKLLLGEEVTPEAVSYVCAGKGKERGGETPPLCHWTLCSRTDDQATLPHPNPLPPPTGGEGEKQRPHPFFSYRDDGNDGPLHTLPYLPNTENRKQKTENPLALVGAGALGNFVALGLAALGFARLTIIDPDPVEVTNLNRQILFWDAVGQSKAVALAGRIAAWFGITPRARTAYVTRETDLAEYAVVFDCTDNFASRIVLSEKCRDNGQVLISGGSGVEAGQVVVYDPARGGPTVAELLGLYDLVGRGDVDVRERERASCVYAPEPAVIMTNLVIGGLMVEAFRRLLDGEAAPNLFYDARGEKML